MLERCLRTESPSVLATRGKNEEAKGGREDLTLRAGLTADATPISARRNGLSMIGNSPCDNTLPTSDRKLGALAFLSAMRS